MNAVMIANEWVRSERKDPGSRSVREDGSPLQPVETRAEVDTDVKASMKTFLQCAVATVLEAWDDSHRYCSF